MFKWLSLLLIIFIASCGGPNGKRYDVGNLEIYYTSKVGFEYVESLGAFFQENNLIHPIQKHSVRLTSSPNEFILNMILNDSLDAVPLDMLKEIEFLEEAIATKVFKNRNFAIVVTDAYFNPIIKPEN